VFVSLTTDFGTADGYVGAMKGVILALAPTATVVDVTHDVPRHDVAAGAFALATAAPWFPAGTIHVAVIDPGVGGARAAVVVVGERHLFVGPDNGLFQLACPAPRGVFAIEAAAFRAHDVAPTFHGRDVFAVAAARLAAGAAPHHAGPEVALHAWSTPAAGPSVIHVDRFGNLVTDLAAARVQPSGRVRILGRELVVVASYQAVPRGALLAYVGSAGTVEIAVRDGDAAAELGAGRGVPIDVVAGELR
jgi:S-adenosyl-L-methionine hydrolase (adenosine-forming)